MEIYTKYTPIIDATPGLKSIYLLPYLVALLLSSPSRVHHNIYALGLDVVVFCYGMQHGTTLLIHFVITSLALVQAIIVKLPVK